MGKQNIPKNKISNKFIDFKKRFVTPKFILNRNEILFQDSIHKIIHIKVELCHSKI